MYDATKGVIDTKGIIGSLVTNVKDEKLLALCILGVLLSPMLYQLISETRDRVIENGYRVAMGMGKMSFVLEKDGCAAEGVE